MAEKISDIDRLLANLETAVAWCAYAHHDQALLAFAVLERYTPNPSESGLLTVRAPGGPEPAEVAEMILQLADAIRAGQIYPLGRPSEEGSPNTIPIRPAGAGPRGICLLCGETHGPGDPCHPPPAA